MSRWRYNPMTGNYSPENIVDEPHTIAFIESINAYGFILANGCQRTTPSTVVVVTDDTAGDLFVESFARVVPDSGKFWVDYDAATYFGTSIVICNPADNGTDVLVSYKSLGLLVSEEGIASILAGSTIPGALTVTGLLTGGDVTATDDLIVGDDATITGDLAVTATSTFTGGFKTEGSDLFRVKKIDIGTWNMVSTSAVNIVLGLTDAQCLKIVEAQAIIINDTLQKVRRISVIDVTTGVTQGNITVFMAPFAPGVDAVATLSRLTGGTFDSTDYDSTGMNRGYVYIVYMV